MTGRILIAGTSSGSGKTVITCGILQALKNRGTDISSCKCGPDYIDPMFHKKVLNIECDNIDLFFGEQHAENILADKKNFVIAEGVMGYFDGVSLSESRYSTYDVAEKTKTPVILVINCKGMGYSAVPLIKGFLDFEKDSRIKGVILNNIKEMTYKGLKPSIEALGIKVYGFLPPLENFKLESRHLGLVTPDEIDDIKNRLNDLALIVEKNIDLDEIIKTGMTAEAIKFSNNSEFKKTYNLKIAVAYDKAFCFYYNANLKMLKNYGCEIVYFSPLNDEKVPLCDGIILGGGYPELYARKLSQNTSIINDIKNKIENGLPCLAECGGFMYLHESMEDESLTSYKTVGVIKGKAFKTNKLVRFGYINLKGKNTLYLNNGTIKAHEFHYWDCSENGNTCTAEKPNSKKSWDCVYTYKNLFAGFPHLYYPSNTEFVQNFLDRCDKK